MDTLVGPKVDITFDDPSQWLVAPLEVARPTKLSEAIREGARGRGQIRGYMFRGKGNEFVCAIGAAVLGVYGERKRGRSLATIKHMLAVRLNVPPEVRVIVPSYHDAGVAGILAGEDYNPVDSPAMQLFDLLPRLNDSFGWTLDEIADYVESLGY